MASLPHPQHYPRPFPAGGRPPSLPAAWLRGHPRQGRACIALGLAGTAVVRLAAAAPADPAPGNPQAESGLCRVAITAAETAYHIPEGFLGAIGQVESGHGPDGARAWPWTINAGGIGHYYASKQEALTAARGFLASGERSLDLGCLQVNLQFHPDAFASLDAAFDPMLNAQYAAKFLVSLFHATGSWPAAAAAYHSYTPALGRQYQQKVLAAWAGPDPRLPFRARDGAPPDPALPDHALPTRNASAIPGQPAQDQAGAGSPVGGAGLGPPPVGGFARVERQGGPMAAPGPTGRTLADYRAIPVRGIKRLFLKK